MANRQLLARATEGTAAPTPGYLYNDLAQAAASNPTACLEMAQYLTNRLTSKNNPNIKFKCLKVIAKLCDQVPRNQFRRCLAQNPQAVAAIKECTHFRGQMDPVCGDEPNQKVRTAAQEAIDAVYREAPSSEQATAPTMMMASHSSSSYAPSPHYASNSNNAPRRMQGIGNPRFTDPRLDPRYNAGAQPPSINEVVKEAGDVILGMIKDPLARNAQVGRVGNLPGGGFGNNNNGYAGRPPPGSAELAYQTGGQWTMASNRGPHAVHVPNPRDQEYYSHAAYHNPQPPVSNNYAPRTTSHTGVGGSWGGATTGHSTPSVHITSSSAPSSAPHTSAPASDGTYEKNLILELCPPGGLKAVPPPDKLSNFAKIVPSLNADLICPVLLDCLEEGQPWIVRAKALCVMETAIRAGTKMIDGSNPYRDFFHACQGEIVPLTAHPRSQIKDPAKRVAALLGIASQDEGSFVSAAPVQAAPAVNLLDFDDAPAAPPSAPPPPPPVSNDMFGGMQVKQKSPTAAATNNGFPPSSFSSPVAAAPVAPSANLLDLVSDPPPATSSSSNANDIFRDMGVKDAQQPAHMFNQMTLNDKSGEDKKTDSEDAGDLTSGGSMTNGSAFGFINESASKDSPGSAPAPVKPNFDPLTAAMSPNTVKKMTMEMSPEQIQAMAYQQMMMQQRMQMQMAYAMQQQGRPMTMPVFNTMPGPAAAGQPGLSMGRMDARPAKKDDNKFDFVKDAMKTQTKK